MLVILFLNELKIIDLHTSIAIVGAQLNGFKYFYITLIVLSNINSLVARNELVQNIAHTNSFTCTQLNVCKYFYQTTIVLFAHN